MTWHLKDRELEKQLIELDSNFLENLNEAMYQFSLRENEDGEDLIGVDMEIYRSPRLITAQLQIEKTDIEKIVEYDPHAWNEYPEVTPPYNAIMRLEFEDATTNRKYYYAAFYTSDGWREAVENGLPKFVLDKAMIEAGLIKNVRFHIWDY